ncbi:hypothetical protein FHS95_004035 [Sphingomonas naasensis]|uniref:Uncharacterized protein n=1 Tax=Sphingomonas naasensis TaxID=1344951 RepID=A0A4S1WG85_9SPHN|nr:hypothetical protein [Sphingomonas naasensis]NIJ22320.1 hypothetical protein [Sphingomonas naasensis]TGX40677.1 hypothetical protein E5A74_14350 [Sphingomonas naasensis]
MYKRIKKTTLRSPLRDKRDPLGARPSRDWFDWATLATAGVGAVVVVTSTVLTQRESVLSGEQAAESLKTLNRQAEASQEQSKAASEMAEVTKKQLVQLTNQINEMRLQSNALSATANAANRQLNQADIHNRISVTPVVGFDRRASSGDEEVGIYIYNHGSGPAIIQDIKIYLDGSLLPNISDLEYVDTEMFLNETPRWNSIFESYTLQPGKELSIYHTPYQNVEDISNFRKLIWDRVDVIFKYCSLYNECGYSCSFDKTRRGDNEPAYFRPCSHRKTI